MPRKTHVNTVAAIPGNLVINDVAIFDGGPGGI
jgi:hypothetical protein